MKFKLTALLLAVAFTLTLMPAAMALPDDVEFNMSDLATGEITTETAFGTTGFVGIPATDGGEAVKVQSSKKTSSTTGLTYTNRYKTGASGDYNNRAIRFSTEDQAVLYVEMMSANSSNSRMGKIINSAGEEILSQEVVPKNLGYYKFIIPEAGDYAFVSEGGGINIYYLKLSYTMPEPEPPTEDLTGTVMTPMDVIYTAPYAATDGAGTKEEPMSVASAVLNVTAGGTIYCEGTYYFKDCLTIATDNSGTEGALKNIVATDGETRFDFSNEPYSGNGSPRGIQINGSYWYIKDLEVYMAADNGFYVCGKHITLDHCVANANRDTGIQISRAASNLSNFEDWPSDILIKNCTSFNSYDPATGENSDGFAAKLTCGNNIVFDGCIAYNNCDDGWDCYTKTATGAIGSLTFRNCVAFRSGQTTEGRFTDNSDGNGFKLGGSKIAVSHTLENCIAFENANHGFTDNSNPGPLYLYNCTAFNNALKGGTKKSNFDFARDKTNSNNTLVNCLSYTSSKIAADKFIGTVKNSALYNNSKDAYYYYEDLAYTNWNDKEGTLLPTDTMDTVTPETFVSIESPALGEDVHRTWRNEDGSINLGNFLKVADNTVYKEMNIGANLSGEPVVIPTPEPSAEPAATPDTSASPEPSAEATTEPDTSASPEPSAEATTEPDTSASPEPSGTPSAAPTAAPTPTTAPTPTATAVPEDYVLLAVMNDDIDNAVDVYFTNNTAETINPVIGVAMYKNDGTILIDYIDETDEVSPGETYSFTEENLNTDCDYIRVFAWDSYENLRPYTVYKDLTPVFETE